MERIEPIIPSSEAKVIPRLRIPAVLSIQNISDIQVSQFLQGKQYTEILLIVTGYNGFIGKFVDISLTEYVTIRYKLALISKQDILSNIAVLDRNIELPDIILCSVVLAANYNIFYAINDIQQGETGKYADILKSADGLLQLSPSPQQLQDFYGKLASIIVKASKPGYSISVSMKSGDVISQGAQNRISAYLDSRIMLTVRNGFIREVPTVPDREYYPVYLLVDEQGVYPLSDFSNQYLSYMINHPDKDIFDEPYRLAIVLLFSETYLSDDEIQSLADINELLHTNNGNNLVMRRASDALFQGNGAILINYDTFPLNGPISPSDEGIRYALGNLSSCEIYDLLENHDISFSKPWLIKYLGYLHWTRKDLDSPEGPSSPKTYVENNLRRALGKWITELDYTKTYIHGWPLMSVYNPYDTWKYFPTYHIELSSVTIIRTDATTEENIDIVREVAEERTIENLIAYVNDFNTEPQFLVFGDDTLELRMNNENALIFEVTTLNPVRIVVFADNYIDFNIIAQKHIALIRKYDPSLIANALGKAGVYAGGYSLARRLIPGPLTSESIEILNTRSIIISWIRSNDTKEFQKSSLTPNIPLERCLYGIIEDEGTPGLYATASCIMATEAAFGSKPYNAMRGFYLGNGGSMISAQNYSVLNGSYVLPSGSLDLKEYPRIGTFLNIKNTPPDAYLQLASRYINLG